MGAVWRLLAILAFATLLFPARLAAQAGPPLEQIPTAPAIAAPAATAPEQPPAAARPGSEVSSTYRLGAGDRVRLIVFGEPDLSGEFVIDGTGRAALPLVGEVTAAGLTSREFEEAIEQVLRGGYLNDPAVSIEVLTYRPFYILGEVSRPGEYPYSDNISVLNAIATAGGFTTLANPRTVVIKREGENAERQMALEPGLRVTPGSTIRVLKGAIYILGEVGAPGEYPYSEGLTVMNAIAMARGFTYRASKNRVLIKRAGEIEERLLPLTPALNVEPGDTIRVRERRW